MASKRFSRLLKILTGAVAGADEIFQLEGRLERFAHFWALVTRQFIRHRCLVRASALSYSTLLALIPLLVVALSVTGSLLNPRQEAELAEWVERAVSSVAPSVDLSTNAPLSGAYFRAPAVTGTNALAAGVNAGADTNVLAQPGAADQPAAAEDAAAVNARKEVAAAIHAQVQKAGNRALGSTSLIFLVITAISLLRGIEETFNDMWGVTRGRNWRLQFMLYWSIISLGPLLLSAALVLTGGMHLQNMRSVLESSPLLAPVIRQLAPVAILSFTLGMFYKLTPNTKVDFSAAMIGGLFAGTAWHIYNQLGFLLVSRALSASKLYGSLAFVVLVMGGLYVLWLIILFGAQIAYCYQNRVAYLQERLAENVNQRGREFVALRIMTCLGQCFQSGGPPATVPRISAQLGIPSRLAQSVLRTLAGARLVTETAGTEAAFVPARPLEAINAYDILTAMRTGTGQDLPVSDAPELAGIYGEFARIERAERNAAGGITLLTLAHRVPARAALTEPKNVVPEPAAAAPQPPPEKTPVAPPVEPPKPAPFPEKTETPELVADAAPPPPSRREPVQPQDHTDFPL